MVRTLVRQQDRRDVMGRALRWAAGAGMGAAGWPGIAWAGSGEPAAALPGGGLEIHEGAGPAMVLSAQALAALPQRTISTHTAWTDGVRKFEGPLVTDVLGAAGAVLAPGSKLQVRALNDYVVEIPAEDFQRWPVIAAWTMDGNVLTRRDKGPFWIVYPRDDDRVLRDAKYDHRWAWQLRQLTVRAASR